MGAYNSALPTLIDLVIRALGPAMPDRVAAAHYGTFCDARLCRPPSRHRRALAMPRQRLRRLGRAACDMDGPGPFRTNCHGDTRLIPIEVHEASYPFMIESFGLRTDSGGAGQFRGGLGLERRYLMLAPCRISTRFERTLSSGLGHERRRRRPAGSCADRARRRHDAGGAEGNVMLERRRPRAHPDRRRRRLRRSAAGATASACATDVMRGYVSAEAAREVYGLDTTIFILCNRELAC